MKEGRKMIITWNEIIEVNRRIKEKGLKYKVHLSDSCGGQSMWIEPLEEVKNLGKELEELHVLIVDYFKEVKADIEFSWDKKSFWTKDRGLIF